MNGPELAASSQPAPHKHRFVNIYTTPNGQEHKFCACGEWEENVDKRPG